jgi:hypothetical protein
MQFSRGLKTWSGSIHVLRGTGFNETTQKAGDAERPLILVRGDMALVNVADQNGGGED